MLCFLNFSVRCVLLVTGKSRIFELRQKACMNCKVSENRGMLLMV